MSLITIDNLTESRELDSAAATELFGGHMSGSSTNNYFYSETTNIFQQNPLNVSISAGDGGIVAMGNFSPMLLSAGSAMSWLQL